MRRPVFPATNAMKVAAILCGTSWLNACATLPDGGTSTAAPTSYSTSYLVETDFESSGDAVLCRYSRGETIRLTNVFDVCPRETTHIEPLIGTVDRDGRK